MTKKRDGVQDQHRRTLKHLSKQLLTTKKKIGNKIQYFWTFIFAYVFLFIKIKHTTEKGTDIFF